MEGKQWYASKTLWVNALAFVALILQSQFGFILGAEEQAAGLLIINAILRLITKKGISLKNRKSDTIIGFCFLCALLLAVSTPACSTFTQNAYQAGAVSKNVSEAVLAGMGDMYRQGLIKESVKNQAIEIGRAYKEVHNESIEALAKYKEKGSPQDKQAYLTLASDASLVLAKLLNFARPYFLEHGKEMPTL